MTTYNERRRARKMIAFSKMYGGGTIPQARIEGRYPPIVEVDLRELEVRVLAGRDPFGEDA